jgi:hypothetical protein
MIAKSDMKNRRSMRLPIQTNQRIIPNKTRF